MELIEKNEIYHRFFDGGSGVERIHVTDIDNIPEVDAAPVVHGRWVKSPDGYIRCSHCGRRRGAVQDRFCGRCGARMDGGEEHEAD